MARNVARTILLASASLMAVGFAQTAMAQTTTFGGGASLPSQDYAGPNTVSTPIPSTPSEEYTWNTANTSLPFEYFYASSGRGQTAFSTDTPSAYGDTNAADPVHYAASDAFLAAPNGASGSANGYTYTVAGGSTTVTYPKIGTDGALIQLPMLGVGIAIPTGYAASGITTTAPLKLQDSDLCGIFSGSITDFSNLAVKPVSLTGPIHVYYRADGSGTSFLFTNHLKNACPTGTFPNQANAPFATFASLFTGGTIPSNFTGENGSAALATALGGTVAHVGKGSKTNPVTGGDKQGIGYISTDFTSISHNGALNDIVAPGGTSSGPYIDTFGVIPGTVLGATSKGTAYLTPTTGNISLAFTHPGAGAVDQNPPATITAAANPLNWIPQLPLVTQGYPIVGFTTWELAQCYTSANNASALNSFLLNHYTASAYNTVIGQNGFTRPSASYVTAIKKYFLTVPKVAPTTLTLSVAGSTGLNATCKAVTGR